MRAISSGYSKVNLIKRSGTFRALWSPWFRFHSGSSWRRPYMCCGSVYCIPMTTSRFCQNINQCFAEFLLKSSSAFRASHSGAKRLLPFEVDTTVEKDVILYKYENPRFFRLLTVFGVLQYLFWMYLAQFAYSTMKDEKPAPTTRGNQEQEASEEQIESSWKLPKLSLGENKYRNGMVTLCITVGSLILFGSFTFCLRTVRYIVLRKGGETVTVVTHAPFGHSRFIDIPLSHVSCQHPRAQAGLNMSLKIKGRSMFFLVDKSGQFVRPKLFDQTVGLYRSL